MSSSIKIDQISFLFGGYGAVGVSLYTYRVYKGITLPFYRQRLNGQNREEWKAKVKRCTKFALCLGLVQLRAVERFFIGGVWQNQIANAAIAGGIVGSYECGYIGTNKMLVTSAVGVAALTTLQEIIFMILERRGFLVTRSISVIAVNYDPLFYIVGALGAYGVGLYTLIYFEDIYFPRFPQINNEALPIILDKWLKFTGKCLSNVARVQIRIEERSFLGGCMAWAVESLFQKIGMDDRFLRATVTGGIVGAYFGSYGGSEKICKSAAGVLALGIVAELLVAPILSHEELWEFILPFPGNILQIHENKT